MGQVEQKKGEGECTTKAEAETAMPERIAGEDKKGAGVGAAMVVQIGELSVAGEDKKAGVSAKLDELNKKEEGQQDKTEVGATQAEEKKAQEKIAGEEKKNA